MAAPSSSTSIPIQDRRQLVEYLEAGSTPPSDWRIGTEHEKFVFNLETFQPAPFDGPWGIRAMLEGLQRFGWQPVLENGNPIALTMADCNISLEPGGQLELSGAPLTTIHQTCDEVHQHLAQVKEVGRTRRRDAGGRVSSYRTPRRHPLDAQGPLRDYAELHAEERQSWT